MNTKPIALKFGEREAIERVRAAIQRDPRIVDLLFKHQSRELAGRILVGVRDELDAMLRVNQAFSAAAKSMAESFKEPTCNSDTSTPD